MHRPSQVKPSDAPPSSVSVDLMLTSQRRGAYCAAVIVSLLNLPLDLTPESPAWTPDHPTLFTNLAEYVQRCTYPTRASPELPSLDLGQPLLTTTMLHHHRPNL